MSSLYVTFADASAIPVPSPQSRSLNILITGASRGIGYELVIQYATANTKNHIFAAVRHLQGESSKTLTTFAQSHPNVHLIPLDVSNKESIAASVSHVTRIVDHLDILINNAGVLIPDDPLTTTPDLMVSTYQTNVVGPLLVVQSYLTLLQKANEAKVINISSWLGSIALVGKNGLQTTSYGVSKAALNYLNRVLAVTYPKILFLSISPGWVDTDLGGAAGTKAPTRVDDDVKAIRYYIDNNNAQKNNGQFLDVTSGQIVPY